MTRTTGSLSGPVSVTFHEVLCIRALSPPATNLSVQTQITIRIQIQSIYIPAPPPTAELAGGPWTRFTITSSLGLLMDHCYRHLVLTALFRYDETVP